MFVFKALFCVYVIFYDFFKFKKLRPMDKLEAIERGGGRGQEYKLKS